MAWKSNLRLFKDNKVRYVHAASRDSLTALGGEPLGGPRIWAVGGGKGGVGKSLVASSFGIYLTKFRNRVLLVDADFGAANLHTLVGGGNLKFSFSSFLKGSCDDIKNVIEQTDIPDLDILSGSKDTLDAADLKGDAITRLRTSLKDLDYDFIVLDTGPGTASNLLDIFLTAHQGVLVTTPDPMAIENTYRFLRSMYLRRIKQVMTDQEDCRLKDILQGILTTTESSKPRTLADVLRLTKEIDLDQWRLLTGKLNKVSISIIVNQTICPEDSDLGPSMVQAWLDYFGVEITYIGQVVRDDKVQDSIRSGRPLALSHEYANAAWGIKKCVMKLLEEEGPRALRLKRNAEHNI